MSALFTRAEPRDFLDVDAAEVTGRYTREQLLDLAEQADAGFDRRVLADLLAMLQRYPDRRSAACGADLGPHLGNAGAFRPIGVISSSPTGNSSSLRAHVGPDPDHPPLLHAAGRSRQACSGG
jgi:hypothetical protein